MAGGLNSYAYAGGNPTNWADPYGLSPFSGVSGAIQRGYAAYRVWQVASNPSRPTLPTGPLPPVSTYPGTNIPSDVPSYPPGYFNEDGDDGGEGDSCGAQKLPDLTDKSEDEANSILGENGFTNKPSQTAGGYQEWVNSDGSRVWVRPNGEIARVGPKRPGKKGKLRFGPDGKIIPFKPGGNTHSTGEIISK